LRINHKLDKIVHNPNSGVKWRGRPVKTEDLREGEWKMADKRMGTVEDANRELKGHTGKDACGVAADTAAVMLGPLGLLAAGIDKLSGGKVNKFIKESCETGTVDDFKELPDKAIAGAKAGGGEVQAKINEVTGGNVGVAAGSFLDRARVGLESMGKTLSGSARDAVVGTREKPASIEDRSAPIGAFAENDAQFEASLRVSAEDKGAAILAGTGTGTGPRGAVGMDAPRAEALPVPGTTGPVETKTLTAAAPTDNGINPLDHGDHSWAKAKVAATVAVASAQVSAATDAGLKSRFDRATLQGAGAFFAKLGIDMPKMAPNAEGPYLADDQRPDAPKAQMVAQADAPKYPELGMAGP
jgi:hypothetical protein